MGGGCLDERPIKNNTITKQSNGSNHANGKRYMGTKPMVAAAKLSSSGYLHGCLDIIALPKHSTCRDSGLGLIAFAGCSHGCLDFIATTKVILGDHMYSRKDVRTYR